MDTQLIDSFGRRVEYLRLSLTDRCDLRCFYCRPKGFSDYGNSAEWLNVDELERMVRSFASLGVRRVRLTGGEPLLRREVVEIARRISGLNGIEDLSLSTNGVRLAKLALQLRSAGVARLNVSLDSLRPDRFSEITGGGQLERVLEGLKAAQSSGFELIKINMVVLRDVNHDEVEEMVSFCIDNNFTLRFIEAMPVGSTGRSAASRFVSMAEVETQLAKRYRLVRGIVEGGGPARYVQVVGTPLRIGFITPISQHFCDTCNRVRMGVDGTLYLCLGDNYSVAMAPLLRSGACNSDLQATLLQAVAMKPERHMFSVTPEKVVRFMSQTGG